MIRRALLTLLACLPAFTLQAETRVYRGEQSLWEDTVWEGEILIDGILTVAPQVTLELRPGTVVAFTSFDSNGDGIGEHELFIQGRLLALGTAAAPIVFRSADGSRPAAWGALNLLGSDQEENRLRHVQVRDAYRGFHAHFSRARLEECRFEGNLRGLQFQESEVVLARCTIADNGSGLQFRDSRVRLEELTVARNHWGVRCVYSELEMTDCVVRDNLANGLNLRDSTVRLTGNLVAGNRRGIYLQRSRGRVADNRVLDSSEHGIFLEASELEIHGNQVARSGRAGIKWLDSHGSLRHNDLEGNGLYALYNDGAGSVDARGNWWGTRAPELIARWIFDGSDRPGLGPVTSDAPLAQPPALKEMTLP